MSIKLITDSSADLSLDLLKSKNISFVPLRVHMDDEEFFDLQEISSKQFFEKLNSLTNMPKTSQVTPLQFIELFSKELEKNDEIICVTIGSAASGTYQSALIAKEEVNSEKIHVIDSKALSMGTGLLVLEIADMIEQGLSSSEIVAQADSIINNIEQRFSVDSLDYLEKGGRIKKSSLVIGKLLNIIPILTVENGITVPVKKARSYKAVFRHYKEFVNKSPIKRICIGHGNDYELAMKLKTYFDNELGQEYEYILSDIGATIGCHAGPGVLHVAVVRK